MSLALIGLYISFVVSGHVTFNAPLCGVSSALLQYFILVFLGWTVVEEVWLYLKLVKVFGIQSYTSNFILKAGVPTWGNVLIFICPNNIYNYLIYCNFTSSGCYSHSWTWPQTLLSATIVSKRVPHV